MTTHRQLDEQTRVAGQIFPADLPGLAAEGVTLIINNRPDGEDEDQPTDAEIEAAASAAGIDYVHVPIARGMGPTEVEAMRTALHGAGDGKVVAFCRSGNRSALAWAVARNEDGVPRAELQSCLAGAGFDLGPVAHLLRD